MTAEVTPLYDQELEDLLDDSPACVWENCGHPIAWLMLMPSCTHRSTLCTPHRTEAAQLIAVLEVADRGDDSITCAHCADGQAIDLTAIRFVAI